VLLIRCCPDLFNNTRDCLSQAWTLKLTNTQSTPDFFTPFIVDDSYDQSAFVGEHFGANFIDAFTEKQSMASQRDILGMALLDIESHD
jgi:hypothetical protein